MAAKNPVTGDAIYTKDSRKYEQNYDRIFRKARKCVECGEEIEAWELYEVEGELFHKGCYWEEG